MSEQRAAPLGVNDNGRVECKKSKNHGHHPANEGCPDCEPEKYTPDDWRADFYANMYTYLGMQRPL